jgi:hypothetical protein
MLPSLNCLNNLNAEIRRGCGGGGWLVLEGDGIRYLSLQVPAADDRRLEANPAHQQQRHPLHHPQYASPYACVLSIAIGLVLIQTSTDSQEVYLRYDNACIPSKSNNDNSHSSACRVTFTLAAALKAPVYFYYGFKGFYQNHRRYLKYYSSNQLSTGDPFASTVSIVAHRPRLTAQITTQTCRPSAATRPLWQARP